MFSESVTATLPTKNGIFRIIVWPGKKGQETVVLVTEHLDIKKPVLVRIHSECLTGDTFSSMRCDCGQQKYKALQTISQSKNGIFIYLRQEGRGIGLYQKIKAYALQEQGYDTHQANILLGDKPDQREYSIAKEILNKFGIKKIKLITNNPSKITDLSMAGFDIVEKIPLKVKKNKYNKKYLETKEVKFKHFLNKNSNNYYVGISDITDVDQIKAIAGLIDKKIKDQFLKISIGIRADSSFLQDTAKQKNIERLFKEAEKYPSLLPILQYSFTKSKNYKGDIKEITKKFPFIKRVRLDDVISDHVDILKYSSKLLFADFPIKDTSLFLLENQQFVNVVLKNKVLISLSNSEGRKSTTKQVNGYKKKIILCLNKGINNICIADSLGQNNVVTYFQIKDYFKINFSIDADITLKTHGALDMKKATSYLKHLLNMPEEKKDL